MQLCLSGSLIGIVLDVPTELMFPGIVFVGSVKCVSLPLRSRSATAVSVVVRVDHVIHDGRVCNADDQCPFRVDQQRVLLSATSSQNIQVSLCSLLLKPWLK